MQSSSFRITIEGCFWPLAGLFFVIQGWLRNFNLVTLIGCMMLALWLLNLFRVLFRCRMGALRVQRQVDAPVFAGQSFSAVLEVKNAGESALAGLRVVDAGRHHARHWFLPVVGLGGALHHRFQMRIPDRGRYQWPALRVSSGHPFGLFRRSAVFDAAQEMIVLPKLGRLDRQRLRKILLGGPQPAQWNQRHAQRHPSAQAEFHGLRGYRSGDSLRSIHWRTSARMGELMVREFEEPPHNSLIVVVEPYGEPQGPSNSTVELAISFAATVCWEWSRQPGVEIALAVAGKKPTAQVRDTARRQVIPLLEMLALAQMEREHDAGRLVNELQSSPLPAGPMLLITTRPSDLGQFLSSRLGRPVSVIDVGRPGFEDLFTVGEEVDVAVALARENQELAMAEVSS